MKEIAFSELMGEHVLSLVKSHGKNVKIHSLAKIANPQFAEIGDEVRILDYAFLDAKESLIIGSYSIICWHCVIEGHSNVLIGNRCFLGPGTKILGSTYIIHGYYTSEHLPYGTHKTEYGNIVIQDDAYLGANCVVMPGVTIGEGAVVGANAFVSRDLEPWGIYVGAPARKVGERERPSINRKRIIDSMEWMDIENK